ncbi:hypothetical protein KTF22_14200 [Burkholderia multivorans]|uniref:hypothetical protein n=1 Tax=Burkholderia multivorans TaxID=87883 RepID=UPI001C235C90|nr:hypothetical protein [Burkholderia multivorans]MBU9663028.1 hypothetical protein [Burkholderia multivorans]
MRDYSCVRRVVLKRRRSRRDGGIRTPAIDVADARGAFDEACGAQRDRLRHAVGLTRRCTDGIGVRARFTLNDRNHQGLPRYVEFVLEIDGSRLRRARLNAFIIEKRRYDRCVLSHTASR